MSNLNLLILLLAIPLFAFAIFHYASKPAHSRRANREDSSNNPKKEIKLPCNKYYLPDIPEEWNAHADVKDVIHKEVEFSINPYKMTCTCDEYNSSRAQYEKLDIRRLCPHLQQYLYTSDVINVIDKYMLRVIKDRVRDDNYLRTTIDDRPVVLGWRGNPEWISIFTGKSDSPVRYGFSLRSLQWSSAGKPKGLVITRSKADKICSNIDESDGGTLYLPCPLSPKDESITISEMVNDSVYYSVNLFEMTCTCPGFTSKYHQNERLDIRRMCRHITEVYCSTDLISQCSDEVQSLVLAGGRNECYFDTNIGDKRIIIGWDQDNEWISVFFPNYENDGSVSYERFAYSISQKRWSHSDSPKGYARSARKVFRELFYPDD